MGNYSRCSWQVKGDGQFFPGMMSNPHTGKGGELSKVTEYRVEMVFEESIRSKVVETLIDIHPYETPAYHFIEVIL